MTVVPLPCASVDQRVQGDLIIESIYQIHNRNHEGGQKLALSLLDSTYSCTRSHLATSYGVAMSAGSGQVPLFTGHLVPSSKFLNTLCP